MTSERPEAEHDYPYPTPDERPQAGALRPSRPGIVPPEGTFAENLRRAGLRRDFWDSEAREAIAAANRRRAEARNVDAAGGRPNGAARDDSGVVAARRNGPGASAEPPQLWSGWEDETR